MRPPPRFMCRKLQGIEVNLDFIRFFSSCRPCRPQRHPNANTFLAMFLLTKHMPRKTSVCRKSDMRCPKAAGRVPFGHSNLIPVRLYRIDRNKFYLFKRRYDHSLVGTAGCAVALTAKPIPAMRAV